MPTVIVLLPGAPAAEQVARAYMQDVASRYYGRPATVAELDQALADEPYDDLAGETGLFVAAVDDGQVLGCAGIRFLGDVAELTKVFTLPEHRGAGVGRLLLGHLETVCRKRGVVSLRLDTRSDLTEACALYERLGFERVPAFNHEQYSDRWYAKAL